MGIFSKGPSIAESFSYAIQAFGTGILKLDEDVRKRVSPVAVGAVKGYISNQSYTEQEKNSTFTMFQIISGTVGVIPSLQLNTYGQAREVSEIIESTLPFNMPMVILGPIRMVIEEYITGQSLSEIGRARPRVIDTSWKVANSLGARSKETLSPALSLNLSTVYHSVTAPQTGWSVSLAPSLFLSGFTDRRPTQTEIQGVMSALSSLIADIDDETKDGQS
jgi:hypothetical protein